MKTDITTKTLEADLDSSYRDISACKNALIQGVTSYSGGPVSERLAGNLHFVKVITTELNRRRKM